MFSSKFFSKSLAIASLSITSFILSSCSTKYERLEKQLAQVHLEGYKSSNNFFANPVDSVRGLQEYLQLKDLIPQNREHAEKVLRMLQFGFNDLNSVESQTVLARLMEAEISEYMNEIKLLSKSADFPRVALQVATLSKDEALRKYLSLNLSEQLITEKYLAKKEADAIDLAFAAVLLEKDQWLANTAALIKESAESEKHLKSLQVLVGKVSGKKQKELTRCLVFTARALNKSELIESALDKLKAFSVEASDESKAQALEFDKLFSRDALLADRLASQLGDSDDEILQKAVLSSEKSNLVFDKKFFEKLLEQEDYKKAASYLIIHQKVDEGISWLKKLYLFADAQQAYKSIYDLENREQMLRGLAEKKDARLYEKLELLSFLKKHNAQTDFDAELEELAKQYTTAEDRILLIAAAIELNELEFGQTLRKTMREGQLSDPLFYRLAKLYYEYPEVAKAAQLFYSYLGRDYDAWQKVCAVMFMTEQESFYLNYASKALIVNEDVKANQAQILPLLAKYAFRKNWSRAANSLINKMLPKDRKLSDLLPEGDVHFREKNYKAAAATYINISKLNPAINLSYLLASNAFKQFEGESERYKRSRRLADVVNMGKYNFHSYTLRYLRESHFYSLLDDYSEQVSALLPPGSPFHGLTLTVLSDKYDNFGKAEKAYRTYKRFVYLQMMSERFFDSPASVLRSMAKLKELELKMAIAAKANSAEVERLAKEALAYSPRNIEVSITLQKSKNKKLFKEVYAQQWNESVRVLKAYPKSPFLLNFTAWVAGVTGQNLEEAAEYSRNSIRLEDNAAYYDTLAEIYMKQGKVGESIVLMDKAVELSNGLPIFIYRKDKFKAVQEK